jgi:hypothetical protein
MQDKVEAEAPEGSAPFPLLARGLIRSGYTRSDCLPVVVLRYKSRVMVDTVLCS